VIGLLEDLTTAVADGYRIECELDADGLATVCLTGGADA